MDRASSYRRLADIVSQTSVNSIKEQIRQLSKPGGSEAPAPRAILMTNKVFIPWYKRYNHTLPEHERIEFQPFEEIDRRDEDIAMQFVYGDDPPIALDERMTKTIRRQAVAQHQNHKEKMDKRELVSRGDMGFRKTSMSSTSSAPSVTTIIANHKAGNKLPDDFDGGKLTEREQQIARDITAYLRYKRQLTRRKRYMIERKDNGFNVWNSNWSLLLKPKNRIMVAMIYRVEYKARIRVRFRRTINLVFACNRFIYILAEISGDTGALVKDIRDFQLQQMALLEQNKSAKSDAKFIFEPSKFKLSSETPVTKSVLFTLTKPWYNRSQREVDLAIKSLQILRCFAELPAKTQRNIATVAWFISIPEDKVMIRQGQEAQDCYIVLSGRVSKTIFVGEPHGEEDALFRHVTSYSKDSFFGEEALTRPGSERDYSITSCVACDILSINMHDYYSFTMLPSDARSLAPDHIKFIGHCNFLRNFPKTQLVEDAETNIYLSYFRPGYVIEYNMAESNWIYVVRWGNCRTLGELEPSRKVKKAHIHRLISISTNASEEEEMLMENRMTEPLKRSYGIQERRNTKSYYISGVVQAELDKLMYDPSLVASAASAENSIDSQVDDINKRKSGISHLLRAKRRADEKEKALQSKRNVESNSHSEPHSQTHLKEGHDDTSLDNTMVRFPSIYKDRSSLSSDTIELERSHHSRRTVCFSDEQNNDDEGTILASTKSSKRAPSVVGSQYRMDTLLEEKINRHVDDDDDILPYRDLTSMTESLASSRSRRDATNTIQTQEQTRNTEIIFTREENKDTDIKQSHASLDSLQIIRISERNKQKKSRWSIEEELANIQIDKKRKDTQMIGDVPPPKGNPPLKHSIWTLRKKLVKGDQIGFDWVNLLDGCYRKPAENPSFVSDGCELVLIRKAFLIKHMGFEARKAMECGVIAST